MNWGRIGRTLKSNCVGRGGAEGVSWRGVLSDQDGHQASAHLVALLGFFSLQTKQLPTTVTKLSQAETAQGHMMPPCHL